MDINGLNVDYKMLADGIGELREVLSMMTKGLENDGFTPREARAIIAQTLSGTPKDIQ